MAGLKKKQKKRKENEESLEIQSLARLKKKKKKKPNYFYSSPKAKDTLGKAFETGVPRKTFQPNTFPIGMNQKEAFGNFLT